MAEREHHHGCEQDGLYDKYQVARTDGSDQPGGKHDGCRYFVLDLTHDPVARGAALHYARQIRPTRPRLARDLDQLIISTAIPAIGRAIRRSFEQVWGRPWPR